MDCLKHVQEFLAITSRNTFKKIGCSSISKSMKQQRKGYSYVLESIFNLWELHLPPTNKTTRTDRSGLRTPQSSIRFLNLGGCGARNNGWQTLGGRNHHHARWAAPSFFGGSSLVSLRRLRHHLHLHLHLLHNMICRSTVITQDDGLFWLEWANGWKKGVLGGCRHKKSWWSSWRSKHRPPKKLDTLAF